MKKINRVIKAGILAMSLPLLIPAGVKIASLSFGASIVANAATPSGSGVSTSRAVPGASGVRTETSNRPITLLNIGAWMQDDKGWWFRSHDGSYPKAKWMELAYDGQTDWYYFDDEGYMLTGWRNINDKWYYLFERTGGRALKGAMAKGWIQINGKWYYLYEKNEGENIEGSRAENTTVGRYRLDAQGVWVQ